MSKAEALVALPSFPEGFTNIQNETGAEKVSQKEGGMSRCLDAVQYLSKNYTQSSTKISSAIADLWAVCHGSIEMRQELATKLNRVIWLCGKMHPLEEVHTLHIDALHPTIFSEVA